MGLVVAGETAMMHQPAEGPLDDPAPRDHLESLRGRIAADGFDVDSETCAVIDGFGAIPGVRPGLSDLRV